MNEITQEQRDAIDNLSRAKTRASFIFTLKFIGVYVLSSLIINNIALFVLESLEFGQYVSIFNIGFMIYVYMRTEMERTGKFLEESKKILKN